MSFADCERCRIILFYHVFMEKWKENTPPLFSFFFFFQEWALGAGFGHFPVPWGCCTSGFPMWGRCGLSKGS